MKLLFVRAYFLYAFLILLTIMLIFEFYIFLIINRDRRTNVFKTKIENYEDLFCGEGMRIHPPRSSKIECPVRGIITSFRHKSLCLNMWRYANLVAASFVTGLDAYVPTCVKKSLSDTFENVSLPVLAEIGHCDFPNISISANSISEWADDEKQSIVISWNDLYNQAVIKYMEEIKRHFVFRKVYVNVANALLQKASGAQKKNFTYIGVYITKTRIVVQQEYDDLYPNVQFFIQAMDHYRRKYSNSVFLLVTDNPKFWQRRCRSRDVMVVNEKNVSASGSLLSVLSHCNHTILGFGNCAIWAAILSKGEAVVSLSLTEDYYSIIQSYPNWIHLNVSNTRSRGSAFNKTKTGKKVRLSGPKAVTVPRKPPDPKARI